MFPTIEKYVDHIHIINGKETRVIKRIEKELENEFKKIMLLMSKGKKVIFTDVDKIIKNIQNN